MIGVIGKRDVLVHPVVTIRLFGWMVFLKALFARRHQTFLSILMASEGDSPIFVGRKSGQSPTVSTADCAGQPAEKAFQQDIIRRGVRLEQAAQRIYASLAEKFAGSGAVEEFFDTLARQEGEHAELLEMCRLAAMRADWDGGYLDPWREDLPDVERWMREAEAKLRAVRSPSDAFWLAVEIESSGINQLLGAIVAPIRCRWVSRFPRLASAARGHLDYVRQTVAELEPGLRRACMQMLSQNTRATPRRGSGRLAPEADPAAAED
jgi:hypothetical protein